MTLAGVAIRHAEPGDHARVLAGLDEWWGGRHMRDMLPRLFFVHFRETTFVAERDGELSASLPASSHRARPTKPTSHLVGVAFHAALGFGPGPPQSDYDGPGQDRVVFSRAL